MSRGVAEGDLLHVRSDPASHSLSIGDVDHLKQKILVDKGFDFFQYRPGCFERRLTRVLRTRNMDDVTSYMKMLDEDPLEYSNLLSALTIDHTSFFRNGRVFDMMRDKVIPELVEVKKSRGLRFIRAWSAGCAGGQEAYSLAMLLAERLEKEYGFEFTVIGTDIDEVSIERARKGIYTQDLNAQIPDGLRARYLQQSQEAKQVVPEIRRSVRFLSHDLIHDRPFKGMDIVFCRNVLIYFAKASQDMILERIGLSLSQGACLVLGMVEGIYGGAASLFNPISHRDHIYMRA